MARWCNSLASFVTAYSPPLFLQPQGKIIKKNKRDKKKKNVKLSNSAFHPAHTPAYLSFFNTVPDWVVSVCVRVWFQHIHVYLLQRNISFLFDHGCDRGADCTVLSQSNPTHQKADVYLSGSILKKTIKKYFHWLQLKMKPILQIKGSCLWYFTQIKEADGSEDEMENKSLLICLKHTYDFT